MKEKILSIVVCDKLSIKEVLKRELSRKYFRHLKMADICFFVRNQQKNRDDLVEKGDVLEVYETKEIQPSQWPVIDEKPDIYYEDEYYLIVNKPHDLLTIPTHAEPRSLFQILLNYTKGSTIHILNRLDKKTGGLVVAAKTRYAAYLLEPTHEKMVRKYLCWVHGIVFEDKTIETYMKKEENGCRRRVCLESEGGQKAISHYRVIRRLEDRTLLEFQLETGRTHQIRLHCAFMGHPIIGDDLYGEDKSMNLELKSFLVSFVHPFTQKKITQTLEVGDWDEKN